ncbi:bacteriocin immunity protein [Aquipseudomonas campi]|uniref:Bacteriocin immunity protein n=1 Tax=Aquipseudomonas campi TaxID=2731681 RepID=A0A6M8FCR8_9GAMM|nr:bacteriocin immunity protein [Pseudomonas campi]
MISLKTSITDYSEDEFLRLIEEICSACASEEYQDELLENFILVSEHPAGSDLIYYPETGNASPRVNRPSFPRHSPSSGNSAFQTPLAIAA